MRLLLLLLCSMSFSSCAVLGVGALIATSAAAGRSADAVKGAEREARQRALDAREAAIIRQRYNELEARSKPPEPARLEVTAAIPQTPTPPPLVPIEPLRKPLRPRESSGR